MTRWYGRKGATMSALGGLDTALWDLRGKAAGQPVRRLLNPHAADTCPAYASGLLWMDDVADLAAEAQGHLDAGFRRMKMRLGKSDAYDLAALEAVRAVIGRDNDLMIDAVMGYDFETALRMLPELARHRAFWLEEPFAPEAIEDYLRLRPAAKTHGVRMSTGENEFGLQGFEEWMRRDAVDIVQPDTCRCGGITEAWRVAELATARGLGVAPHTWSDAVAMTANAQIVAATPRGITVEIDRTGNPFIDELLTEPLTVHDGMLRLSDAPGLGITLRQATIDRYRIPNAYDLPDGNYSDFSFGAEHYQGGSGTRRAGA
jgi:L-alanine-DL-glutamate epimerase-like enolase superfamily enzyme